MSGRPDTPPYEALAAGYDWVMGHVDYAGWAAYVHQLVQQHHPGARDVLELGCGTGSLARHLQPLGPYRYTGTDAAPAMIREARRKARRHAQPLRFDVADFTDFGVDAPVDVIVLVYDGINYLTEIKKVNQLLDNVIAALGSGGIFVFDQSTPANSVNNEEAFRDEGARPGFAYVRESRYDPATSLHTTTFDLLVEGRRYVERHVQRAYTLASMRERVQASGLAEVAVYDGRTRNRATTQSERIHWVLRRPGAGEARG